LIKKNLSNFVFDKKLNGFARKYLVRGNEHLVEDIRNFEPEYQSLSAMVGELLLLHEGVAFSVYGENIPLTMLINWFGLKGLEALLEQGAIEFVLRDDMITYVVDDIKGILPLQIGQLNSSVHCDPEASATEGLKWLASPLPRRNRRALVRKAIKAYKAVPGDLNKEAVEIGYKRYKSNLFAAIGLPCNKDLEDLNKEERAKLCGLTTETMELALLAHYQYLTRDCGNHFLIAKAQVERLHKAGVIAQKAEIVFNIEKIPDISSLIKAGQLPLKEIPRLRASREATAFRSWLARLSDSTGVEEVSREYISALTKSNTFWETRKGKLLKTLGVSMLGMAVGGALAGVEGAVAGIALGEILEQAAGITLDLLDVYILDGLGKGWTPKDFIEKRLKPLVGNEIE
jgi:hypothetical protein